MSRGGLSYVCQKQPRAHRICLKKKTNAVTLVKPAWLLLLVGKAKPTKYVGREEEDQEGSSSSSSTVGRGVRSWPQHGLSHGAIFTAMPLGAAAGLPSLERKAPSASRARPLEARATEASSAAPNGGSGRPGEAQEPPQRDSRGLDQVNGVSGSSPGTAAGGGENPPSNNRPASPAEGVEAPGDEPLLPSLVPQDSALNSRLTDSRRAEIEELLRHHPDLLREDTSESEGEAGAGEPHFEDAQEDEVEGEAEPAHCGPPTFNKSPPRVSLLWRVIALATTGVELFLFAKQPRVKANRPQVLERPPLMRFHQRGQPPDIPEFQSIGDSLLESLTDQINSILD